MKNAVLVLLLLSGMLSAQERPKAGTRSLFNMARPVTGTVAGVDMTERTLTVREPDGRETTFIFRSRTDLVHLTTGDSVTVQYRNTKEDPIPASKAVVIKRPRPRRPPVNRSN